MPQTMMNKFDLLVSSHQWNNILGLTLSKQELADVITEVLGVADQRTINFWLGKHKISWKKQRKYKAFPAYTVVTIKNSEWKAGFLERHGYIELTNEQHQTFKIIRSIKPSSSGEICRSYSNP